MGTDLRNVLILVCIHLLQTHLQNGKMSALSQQISMVERSTSNESLCHLA